MKDGKIILSLFALIAIASGIVFTNQAISTGRDIDKLAFDPVVGKLSGEVAGAEISNQEVMVAINDGQDKKFYSLILDNGSSVLSALELIKADFGLNFLSVKYDFGTLIEEINGLKNGAEGKYWMYYVNEKVPNVSVDNYNLSPGDQVEFKFEKI